MEHAWTLANNCLLLCRITYLNSNWKRLKGVKERYTYFAELFFSALHEDCWTMIQTSTRWKDRYMALEVKLQWHPHPEKRRNHAKFFACRKGPSTLREWHVVALLRLPVDCHWLSLASAGFLSTLAKAHTSIVWLCGTSFGSAQSANSQKFAVLDSAELVFRRWTKKTCF